jgi:DNA-damage-inducible protein D
LLLLLANMKKEVIIEPLGNFETLMVKAKDFANELNSHNVIEKDLAQQNQISNEQWTTTKQFVKSY